MQYQYKITKGGWADLVVVSLNHFQEESGPVLHGLGEDLEEVAIVVKVHQNVQPLESVHVFFHRDLG